MVIHNVAEIDKMKLEIVRNWLRNGKGEAVNSLYDLPQNNYI